MGNVDARVLIVEDSQTQALKLMALLETRGISSDHTASAEEALGYLAKHRPGLVIVDYHLPGMQGNEFCRLLRQNPGTEHVPLLILTGDDDGGVEWRGLESGADDYVRKSADTDILLARVEALLKRRVNDRSNWNPAFFKAQTVLVVDDSATYLAFLEHNLSEAGYTVITASGGSAALDVIEEQSVDCVVLDLIMPEMDGIDVCRRISEMRLSSHVTFPILMLTNKDSKDAMMRALDAGADDFVSKSNDPSIINARIRALLRRKLLHDEHERILEEFRQKEVELVRERADKEAAQARAQLVEQLEEANRELKETQVQLVQAAKMASLGELVAGVAHEVNNPLAYSMSHVSTIQSALDGVAEEIAGGLSEKTNKKLKKARERINDVLDGLGRVQELVTKLRTFSRLDEGEFKQADLRECIESTLTLMSHRLKEIDVITDFSESNEIFCAPGNLNQVILTLLSNALDAIGEDKHDARISIATEWEADTYVIRVADTGPGIPEDLKDRIFEPFFTTKEVGQGTGLGLAIAYRIVERHGGKIEHRSSAGGGAEFLVALPAAPSDSGFASKAASA